LTTYHFQIEDDKVKFVSKHLKEGRFKTKKKEFMKMEEKGVQHNKYNGCCTNQMSKNFQGYLDIP
jgi:hypothetical protein